MTKKVNARRVGHKYETDIAKELRELTGDESIKTSRYASRELDDAKVDISGTQKFGFHLQLKRYKNNPNLFQVLDEMPKDDLFNVVMWKKPHVGELVAMTKEDFYKILTVLINERSNIL